ncbi:uncharacterized protein METZ01_LOCUS73522 [marine metagenome]|jgi:hypothetical protein|uniref:Smr domain-containing protein n=1 Tax=marine metagenome TaxID=408172 RepID=A0A381TYY8_9ZZZZ
MNNSALDLHGIRHDQVARTVENFVLLNQDQIPLEIICGNSQKMIDLVISVLVGIGCENFQRIDYGTIMIRKL